jgi:uncharacterized membrane protein YjjP (DUF1212 family)
MEKQTIYNILMWIFFLPAAFIGSILIIIVLNYLNSYYLPNFICEIISNWAGGAMFVFIGWYIVPNYKKVICIILAIFYIVFCLVSIYLGLFITNSNIPTLLYIIISAIGAGVGSYYAYSMNEI